MALLDIWAKKLFEDMENDITEEFLELLLRVMQLDLRFCDDYRKNIDGFKGKYLFKTADNTVITTASFNDGRMNVGDNEITDWNAKITFKNSAALRKFLFSKNQDILDSLLANTVEVDGNLNYIYKFGFLARDLRRRLLPE